MDLNFPLEKFQQVKQEMIAVRQVLEKEKAAWLTVRNTLHKARANELDERFKAVFEQVGTFFFSPPTSQLQAMQETIRDLVHQGASASLLGNDELGSYNLAMLIKETGMITSKSTLDITTEIIRITIIAGANLQTQKAYVGNGGAIGLEWICMYLAGGIGDSTRLQNLDQYISCYKIFSWIIDDSAQHQANSGFNPFNFYLAALKESPTVADWQEKLMLAMIYYGFSPITRDDLYYSTPFFSRVAAIQISWISLLFPFEEVTLKHYISALQSNITKGTIAQLINGFTSNNKTRKYFRSFFSLRSHWLLRYIIESVPEIIFDLVKRNEQEMLMPFLKNFKPAIMALQDEKGNTLLHHTVLSRGLVENTIQLLRNNGLSLQTRNKEGLTPLALAEKNNRMELVKLLK
jgi:hypothetical protein